jgi:hypothetical protein
MSGPAPKLPAERRRRNKPASGEWKPTTGIGWQHGPIPPHPDGLMPASIVAWQTWFTSWFASHWTPADLPGLRGVIQLYDACERHDLTRAAERRMSMDGYGITPAGQQKLHWQAPKAEDAPKQEEQANAGPYAHLRAV